MKFSAWLAALTGKTTPHNDDVLVLLDSEASSVPKKITRANLLSGIMTNPMTTAGDIIYGDTDGAPARLAKGSAGQVLKMNSGETAPEWGAAPSSSGGGWSYPADGRLTLESGVPISTTDQTAKTTLYYTPYLGDQIALYDGVSTWNLRTFTELSISVPTTTDTNYDVFCYDNSETATLELTAWTNATTRATALTRQNGVLVKTGETTRRYLGTIRTTGVSGQCEDSLLKRFVWNFYNRIPRFLRISATDNHTYTSNSYRAWNNDTSKKVEFVHGETNSYMVSITVRCKGYSEIYVGLDRFDGGDMTGVANQNSSGEFRNSLADYISISAGFHYLGIVEYSFDYVNAGQAIISLQIAG